MEIRHIELTEANSFVVRHHRHHSAVAGHRFSIGCFESGALCGVAIVGRPTARHIDQRDTVEVLRLCTDGTKNACSKLYAACRRAAKELGYRRIITYILETEDGTSLKASGWHFCHTTKGGSWDKPSRPRTDKAPLCPKKMFEAILIIERRKPFAGNCQYP